MIEAIRNFHTINKQPPEQIILYRDGVGEGMFDQVFEHEYMKIRDAIQEHYPGYKVLKYLG